MSLALVGFGLVRWRSVVLRSVAGRVGKPCEKLPADLQSTMNDHLIYQVDVKTLSMDSLHRSLTYI